MIYEVLNLTLGQQSEFCNAEREGGGKITIH